MKTESRHTTSTIKLNAKWLRRFIPQLTNFITDYIARYCPNNAGTRLSPDFMYEFLEEIRGHHTEWGTGVSDIDALYSKLSHYGEYSLHHWVKLRLSLNCLAQCYDCWIGQRGIEPDPYFGVPKHVYEGILDGALDWRKFDES